MPENRTSGRKMRNFNCVAFFLLMAFISFPAFAGCDAPMHVNAIMSTRSCSTSSASVAYNGTGPCLAIENTGSVGVFIKSGSSTVTAATTDNYLAPGKGYIFTKGNSETHLACITASSTATIYMQSGNGD